MSRGRAAVMGLTAWLVLALPGSAGGPYGKLPASASAVLDGAETVEILSIDPRDRPAKAREGFHGWKVLGRTTIRDARTRRAVVDAIRRGVDGADKASGCFEPRHGLRATKDGRAVDLVICFSCGWIEVDVGGETSSVWTSGAAKPGLNKVLGDAGVLMADDPGAD